MIDPDIKSNPYCKKCKEDAFLKVLIGINEKGLNFQ